MSLEDENTPTIRNILVIFLVYQSRNCFEHGSLHSKLNSGFFVFCDKEICLKIGDVHIFVFRQLHIHKSPLYPLNERGKNPKTLVLF